MSACFWLLGLVCSCYKLDLYIISWICTYDEILLEKTITAGPNL
uniref:Uncharacterized protein n=1 Tax=Arundo donax TaxID=35708 RepID=A0A0A8YG09_ARUDO